MTILPQVAILRVHIPVVPVVAFQSIPVSNRPGICICDSLQVTNVALDVVSIAAVHANTSFEVLAT